MKNDIIIKKIVGYIDKIQGYCDGKIMIVLLQIQCL